MDFTVLLDAPDGPVSRIPIAKLGEFKDGRYGEFAITRDDVQSWKENLDVLPGKRALIDLDHAADRAPRKTEAAGWITNVDFDGDTPVADVEWTPVGEKAIEEKRYLFFSPTYGPFKDESGTVHENTLVGGALTNKPFLNMPALTLASDERLEEALDQDPAARVYQRALDGELGAETRALVLLDVSAGERKLAVKEGNALPDGSYPIRNTAQLHAAAILAASGHGNAAEAKKLIRRRAKELGVSLSTLPGFAASSDSRRAMDKELLTTLDLGEDASESDVLEAVKTLAEKAAEKPAETETKTLEQQAEEANKVLLDADEVRSLRGMAGRVTTLEAERSLEKFTTLFDKCVANGKALEAEREDMLEFHKSNAERTHELLTKRLENGPQLVNTKPSGWKNERQQLEDAPEGVHPGSHSLDAQVRDRLKELGKPISEYGNVLEQMIAEGAAV